MSTEKTTWPKPNRAPKKYPQKDLHGRARAICISYNDLRRFQDFYINVLGWDMIEMPLAASGIPAGDPHPSLLIGTGPMQYDYEAVTLGHLVVQGRWSGGDKAQKVGPMMEIHMEEPLEETIQMLIDHGGKLILDKSKAMAAKPLDDSKQSWEIHAVIEDPGGNYIYLWKVPESRTWQELECKYDEV